MQLRLQVHHRRHLTYKDIAEIAHTSQRCVSEWMRGATSPMAMCAVLHLLGQLPPEDVTEILSLWRKQFDENTNSAPISIGVSKLDRHTSVNFEE